MPTERAVAAVQKLDGEALKRPDGAVWRGTVKRASAEGVGLKELAGFPELIQLAVLDPNLADDDLRGVASIKNSPR